jgi:hypothetical protein
MSHEFNRMLKLAGLTEIKVKRLEHLYNFNKFEVNMDPTTNIPTDKDKFEHNLQRLDLNTVEEIPFLSNVKKYINDQIEDIKQNEDIGHLKDVGFFENEFEENIIDHFGENMPNAFNVSQKVKAYIDYLLKQN